MSVVPREEIEEAVYPYLGPARTPNDVEQARTAIEKLYQDKGYQAAVSFPPQNPRRGIIVLQVTEGKIGKLRVKGSRYFLPSAIKQRAESLAQGRVFNYNDVTRDILALNQLPDRKVVLNPSSFKPGEEPGTYDVDLTVQDNLPLHGSVELNNRYSADTTELRLSGSLSYNNLWQAGHSIGATYQVSPLDTNEGSVFSGYYIARFPHHESLSLMLQGTKNDSNVNTLGTLGVAGKGETLGARMIMTLPQERDYYHSFNFGFDYKNFDQQIRVGPAPTDVIITPITYYPLCAFYSGTWAPTDPVNGTPKGYVTEVNAGVTFGIRGIGSRSTEFDQNRFRSDGNFIYLRGDVSHTHNLPGGFEFYGKVQGQVADKPLVSSEQFGGGGASTARGYLESEVLGDNAIFGTIEVRSPSLLSWLPWKGNEWRIHIFGDAGALTIRDPLPEQDGYFRLASYGVGTRLQLTEYLNGSVDFAIPAISEGRTKANEPFLSFRVSADF